MNRKKTGARVSAALWMVPCLLSAAWLAACGGAEFPEESSPVAQQEQAVVTLPIRINSGGGAFTDTYGRLWQADTSYYFGSAFQTTEPIAGTENDGLYQSMRVGDPSLEYEIAVPGPGIYTVQFLLIEPERNLSAPRSMYITAEGKPYLDRYQGMTTPLRSYTLFFDVPVTDGFLSLRLMPNPGSPPAVVSAVEVTPSKWSWVGGSPLDGRVTGRPALAVDGNNRPVIAWEDSYSVYAARWTGSTYQQLGGPLNTTPSIRSAVMVDASGAPVVSFIQIAQDSTDDCVRTRRWTGTAWVDVGGLVCLPTYDAVSVASAFDKQGQPLLAVLLRGTYLEDARVHVYRFNGVAWEQVGDAVGALGYLAWDLQVDTAQPVIAVDSSDRIVVAWDEYFWRGDLAGKSYAHVFRRNNGQWVRVGTQLPSSNVSSRYPSLALAPNGTPWVAYLKDGAVEVVREQSGAWVSTSTTGLKGWSGPVYSTNAPLLRIDSAGTATVVLLEQLTRNDFGRFLRKWNGTAWAVVDNHFGPLDTSYLGWNAVVWGDTDMAFALTSSGQPVLAIPELPASGSSGYLRIRTYTP